MPYISLACEEGGEEGDLILAMITGRMRMVRDRLRAFGEQALLDLAQELDDVLPTECTGKASCRCVDCVAYDESSPL